MEKRKKRILSDEKGQTAVEYILTTLALLVVFTGMYVWLQKFLSAEFKAGAKIVVSVYGDK